MSCYRLTFQNAKAFEVIVEPVDVAGNPDTSVCTALIYRVTNNAREHAPMHRLGGGPITIYAVSEQAALDIARDVLSQVTSSRIDRIDACGQRSMLPPLPTFAV
jgi:hypothetical protein